MKKILSLLLALIFIFSVCCLASAEEDTAVTINYDETTKTLTLEGEGYLEIDYYPDCGGLFEVDGKTNQYADKTEKIVVKEGITRLDPATFAYFKKVKTVEFPNTLTEIGSYAFYECNSINSINLPSSLVKIGQDVFLNCNKLNKITVDENNPNFVAYDNVLYNKDETELILAGKQNEKIKIKPTVKSTAELCFANCKKLTEIVIPKSVSKLGAGAFYNCTNLKKVTFQKNSELTEISDYYIITDPEYNYGVFENCKKLEKLVLPKKLKNITRRMVANCRELKYIFIGESVKSLHEYFKYYKWCTFNFVLAPTPKLKNIKVSANNKYFSSKDGVLFNKNKRILYCYPMGKTRTKYTVPKSVRILGDFSFANNKSLKTLKLNNKLTEIQYYAMFNTPNITKITVPKSVKKIYRGAIGYKRIADSADSECDLRYENGEDNFCCNVNKKVTIYCKKGSKAHKYAKKNNIKYKLV